MHLYLAIAIATALVVAPEGDAAVSEPPVSSLTYTISSSGMSHGRPHAKRKSERQSAQAASA